MKVDERREVVLVGGFDRNKVFLPNRTEARNRIFRPADKLIFSLLQPDIREHPRPPAISVFKWMDMDGPVMESDRLLNPAEFVPIGKVREELGELVVDLIPGDSNRLVCAANPPRPSPDIFKHFPMKVERP